jgi:Galactose oxidase, central domain
MSFWSRKSKKDTDKTSSSSPAPDKSIAPSSFPVPPSNAPVTDPPQPLIPPPRVNVAANDAPDSPSLNGPSRSASASGTSSPWAVRKFRNTNPFPRYGHAANASVGKEGEIYVFGGLVKDKRKNDLFVIDSGHFVLEDF